MMNCVEIAIVVLALVIALGVAVKMCLKRLLSYIDGLGGKYKAGTQRGNVIGVFGDDNKKSDR